MILLSWSNPKVWVMVPVGAVAANFYDNIWINSLLFYWVGFPLYLITFGLWFALGKLGNKAPVGLMTYFNALLLGIFALYLGYEAINLWNLTDSLIIH